MPKPRKIDSPQDDNPFWEDFVKYADANGISLEHRSDWQAWWHCFVAGTICVMEARNAE